MNGFVISDTMIGLFRIVASVCAVLVTYWVIPWIKSKMNNEKLAQLESIVDVAVRAAEQTITGSGKGEVKKDQVVNFVSTWLEDNVNIVITPEQLSQIIESAVFNMKLEVDDG